MKLNRLGQELLKRFEQDMPKMYQDSAGYWTIGRGHNLGTKDRLEAEEALRVMNEPDPWSPATIEKVFTLDVEREEAALDPVLRRMGIELNENQYAALVCFVFNLGVGPLITGSVDEKLARGDYRAAADTMEMYVNSGSRRKVDGLIRRRAAERQLFETPPCAPTYGLPQGWALKVGGKWHAVKTMELEELALPGLLDQVSEDAGAES